jgi:hypothetical protein
MNKSLKDNNYLIIPNFISSYRANKLKEEFIKYSEENFLYGDSQCPDSLCAYNYVSFLEILCEKTPRVSEVLEETVIPTYTYSRIYQNGSVLDPHVDRDACEISLTLHLGGDSPWPIYIKTPNGTDKCITLSPGDAMLYLGCEAEHWRKKYEGEEYVQVFLHYVRSRGDKFYAYFDKARTDNTSNIIKNKNTDESDNVTRLEEDNLILKNEPVDINKTKNNSSMFLNIKPDNTLEDFIEVFDGVFSDDLCNLILDEYKESSEWNEATVGSGNINFDIRNCNVIHISTEPVIVNNFDHRKKIDDLIFESVRSSMDLYIEKHKTLQVQSDTGYDLLRYKEGQYYNQHTDSYGPTPNRILSCSIQLNDDYEGGEFAFFNEEMLIRSGKGSVIMFPSNFMYPHEVMPVTKGTRYSIVTWLV